MIFPEIEKVVHLIGRVEHNLFIPLGTCTLLDKLGLFATASHVVNGDDSNLVVRVNTKKFNEYQDTDNKQHKCIPAIIQAIDPIRDTCILSVKQTISSNLKLSNTDCINPGETVTVFGFPHANLGRTVLTQQTCEVGAKILISNNGLKSKHIVLNIQSRPGQSGSPIIRNADLSFVGILIGSFVPGPPGVIIGGIDPQSLHQTTHAVSTEYLQGMIKNV